jgi:hypothetical protein
VNTPDHHGFTLISNLMRIEVKGGLWITGASSAIHPAGVVVDTPR